MEAAYQPKRRKQLNPCGECLPKLTAFSKEPVCETAKSFKEANSQDFPGQSVCINQKGQGQKHDGTIIFVSNTDPACFPSYLLVTQDYVKASGDAGNWNSVTGDFLKFSKTERMDFSLEWGDSLSSWKFSYHHWYFLWVFNLNMGPARWLRG